YSLGVVLYEAITGELPYTADNPIAVSMKHVNEPLRPPKELNPKIPEGMNAVVVKLLAKRPEDRYADANELADDLYRISRGLAPAAAGLAAGATDPTRANPAQAFARATTVEAPAARVRKRRRRLPVPALLLALVALAGLGYLLSLPFHDFGFEDLLGGSAQGVEVPSVESLPRDQAVQTLDQAGFGAELRERESSVAQAGVVLDQTPSEGQSAKRGSSVILAVGAGPSTVEVPGVVGLSEAAARAALDRAGLVVGTRYEVPSETAPEGQVVEQGYPAGSAVDPGTAVNLGVSSGPPDPASSASSSASASASPAASSSASASASSPSSASPAANPSSAPPDERREEKRERKAEKIEEAQERAEERAKEAEKRAKEAEKKDE
ncbi:MAG: PASTA domain-containing protein, partial [Actinomycetota bacterium]|nr:PASTA domain-containing protein [Actinomycetota bacterium]